MRLKMKELRLKKLTQARMEQWLRENPTRVFKTNNPCDCPVASFLKGVYPKATIHTVGNDGGNITPERGGDMVRFHLPKWVRKFIAVVDTGYTTRKITSSRALGILVSI